MESSGFMVNNKICYRCVTKLKSSYVFKFNSKHKRFFWLIMFTNKRYIFRSNKDKDYMTSLINKELTKLTITITITNMSSQTTISSHSTTMLSTAWRVGRYGMVRRTAFVRLMYALAAHRPKVTVIAFESSIGYKFITWVGPLFFLIHFG